jgi:hypothetical protein
MDKKYQVFISSTYKDLVEQRNQVVETVLRLSHLPVGMEIFNAASITPWDVIKSHIDNSDYYVLILAHRYGSETSEGISYTEKEYDYAISLGIPCLAFVLKEGVKWNPELMEQKPLPKKKLSLFKKKIHVHHISYWENTEDLGSQVLLALVDEIRNRPSIGWIRANSITTSPVVAEELSRLSKENSELKAQLIDAQSKKNDELSELKIILSTVKYKFEVLDKEIEFELKEIFLVLCVNQERPFADFVLQILTKQQPSQEQLEYFDSAFKELSLLGLIQRHITSAGKEIWRITDLGTKLYVKINYLLNRD